MLIPKINSNAHVIKSQTSTGFDLHTPSEGLLNISETAHTLGMRTLYLGMMGAGPELQLMDTDEMSCERGIPHAKNKKKKTTE